MPGTRPSLLLRPAGSARRAEPGLQSPQAHPGRPQRPGDGPASASHPPGRANPPTAHTPGQIFRSSRSERRLERTGDIIGRSVSGPDGASLQCRRADGPAIRFGSRRQGRGAPVFTSFHVIVPEIVALGLTQNVNRGLFPNWNSMARSNSVEKALCSSYPFIGEH